MWDQDVHLSSAEIVPHPLGVNVLMASYWHHVFVPFFASSGTLLAPNTPAMQILLFIFFLTGHVPGNMWLSCSIRQVMEGIMVELRREVGYVCLRLLEFWDQRRGGDHHQSATKAPLH